MQFRAQLNISQHSASLRTCSLIRDVTTACGIRCSSAGGDSGRGYARLGRTVRRRSDRGESAPWTKETDRWTDRQTDRQTEIREGGREGGRGRGRGRERESKKEGPRKRDSDRETERQRQRETRESLY